MNRKVWIGLAVMTFMAAVIAIPLFAAGTAAAPKATFTFYKGDAATAGNEFTALDLKVGDTVTVTVKGVGADGKDLTACPTWNEIPKGTLQLTKIADKCMSISVKALKAAQTDSLKANFGKNEIGTIKGAVAVVPPAK